MVERSTLQDLTLELDENALDLLLPSSLLEEETSLLRLPHTDVLEQAWIDVERESEKDVSSPESVAVRRKWARVLLAYWRAEVEQGLKDGGETASVSFYNLRGITQGSVLEVRSSTPLESSKLTAVSEPGPRMPSVRVASQVKSPEAGNEVTEYIVFISRERDTISSFAYREIVSGTEREPRLIDDGTLSPPMSQPPLYPLT